MNQLPPPGSADKIVSPAFSPLTPAAPAQPGYAQPGYARPGSGAPPWLMPEPPSPSPLPLRPMSVSEILNGSITLIRLSPGGTLGLCLILVTASAVIFALGAFAAYRTGISWFIPLALLLIWPCLLYTSDAADE